MQYNEHKIRLITLLNNFQTQQFRSEFNREFINLYWQNIIKDDINDITDKDSNLLYAMLRGREPYSKDAVEIITNKLIENSSSSSQLKLGNRVLFIIYITLFRNKNYVLINKLKKANLVPANDKETIIDFLAFALIILQDFDIQQTEILDDLFKKLYINFNIKQANLLAQLVDQLTAYEEDYVSTRYLLVELFNAFDKIDHQFVINTFKSIYNADNKSKFVQTYIYDAISFTENNDFLIYLAIESGFDLKEITIKAHLNCINERSLYFRSQNLFKFLIENNKLKETSDFLEIILNYKKHCNSINDGILKEAEERCLQPILNEIHNKKSYHIITEICTDLIDKQKLDLLQQISECKVFKERKEYFWSEEILMALFHFIKEPELVAKILKNFEARRENYCPFNLSFMLKPYNLCGTHVEFSAYNKYIINLLKINGQYDYRHPTTNELIMTSKSRIEIRPISDILFNKKIAAGIIEVGNQLKAEESKKLSSTPSAQIDYPYSNSPILNEEDSDKTWQFGDENELSSLSASATVQSSYQYSNSPILNYALQGPTANALLSLFNNTNSGNKRDRENAEIDQQSNNNFTSIEANTKSRRKR